MTAAYTDDPTIVQEQNTEKKTITVATKTPTGKKEETMHEEERGNNNEEITKHATGGQDKREIPVDQEISVSAARPIDASCSIEWNDKDVPMLEKSENSQESDDDEHPNDSNTDSPEDKADVSINHEESSTTSIVLDTSVQTECDAFTEDDSRSASNTRATDLRTSLKSVHDANGATKIHLQELQQSVDIINVEARKETLNDFEDRKVVVDEECENFRDVVEEIYDPESELNFHEAVRAGDAKCVAALLISGTIQNLDEPDWNVSGDPPLLVAATNHCLPVLSLLLENGCDPAVRSPRGETALHRVILNGGPGNVFKFVAELLKYDCPPGVKEAGGGLTALHVLTRQLAHAQGSKNLHHNFEAALKTLDLLARAGPVNAKDHQGRTALHILATSTIFDNNHRTEIESLIETLLAAGADPSSKNDRGETPLHECLECGALNTAFLLIPHTPIGITSRYGETPLHIASRKNYPDMVAKLLEHGEDPSVQDAGGNTPLHLASARGFHQTVSLLVTSPLAQLEKVNIEGLTALQVAAESGFVNAVRLLLKAGADPSQTIHYCTTTLHRHPDISILIDHELTRRRQLAA